jgi:hypothetical protein
MLWLAKTWDGSEQSAGIGVARIRKHRFGGTILDNIATIKDDDSRTEVADDCHIMGDKHESEA